MVMAEGKKKGQVFIRGLTAEANEKDLEVAFSKFGPVDDVVIPKDRETRAPKGFAFLTFMSPEDCADAIKGMDGKELNGSPISVEEASERRMDRDRRMDRGRGRGRGYRDSGRGFSRDGFRGRGRGGSRDFGRGGRGSFRGSRGSSRGGFRDSSRMRFDSRDFDRGPPRDRSRDMDRGPRDSFGGSGRDFGYSNGFKSFGSRDSGREYGDRGERYGSSRDLDSYSSRGYDSLSSRDIFGGDRYGSSRSSGYDRDSFGTSSALRYSKSSPLDYGDDRFASLGSRYDEPRSLSSRYDSMTSSSRYDDSRDYGGRDGLYDSYSSSRGFEGGSRGPSERGFARGPPRDDRGPRDDRRERRMPRDLDDGPPMKRPRSDGPPMRGRGMRGRGFRGGPRGGPRH